MPRLVVVSAGVGQPSATRLLADRLADAAVQVLADRGQEVTVEHVELRTHARDLATAVVTGAPGPRLAGAINAVAAADAVIAVTPIFNASYSGLFKLFVDAVSVHAPASDGGDPEPLAGTPVLVAATGGTGRHSLALDHALRPLFAYLRAVVVPTGVYAATEDWASPGGLTARIDRAATELALLLGSGAPPSVGEPESQGGDVGGTGPADVSGFESLLAVYGGSTPAR